MRLPVTYGILEDNPPVSRGQESLYWAFRTAKSHGLGVLLDLHGVPGSQNGMDHSGRAGEIEGEQGPRGENRGKACDAFGRKRVDQPVSTERSRCWSMRSTIRCRCRSRLASSSIAPAQR